MTPSTESDAVELEESGPHRTPGLLAGVPRSDGGATSTSMTSRAWRTLCAAAMSRKCSVTLAVIAAFVLMPHQQPFHATPLLYGTLWLWWAAPLLMPGPPASAYSSSEAAARAGCVARRCASAGACVHLVLAYEHGFPDRVWWEETGFKLCYDCSGGGRGCALRLLPLAPPLAPPLALPYLPLP